MVLGNPISVRIFTASMTLLTGFAALPIGSPFIVFPVPLNSESSLTHTPPLNEPYAS